jgi:acetyl-CoA carboxylase biotin carboxylase subunit
VSPALRAQMGEVAVRAALAAGYTNAGTVEFLLAPDGNFYFLEVNARLQVEHPVTEEVTGIDLVREQLRIASGEPLGYEQAAIEPRGYAVECRIYAEDPAAGFLPSTGQLIGYRPPAGAGVRVDSGVEPDATIGVYYDPMIAKLIVWGADRDQSIRRMRRALTEFAVNGITTNIPYHLAILDEPDFAAGRLSTHFIPDHPDLGDRCADWTERKRIIDRSARDNAVVAAIGAAIAVTL